LVLLWDNSDQGDLQVPWSSALDFLPGEDLAEAGVQMILNVLMDKGNAVFFSGAAVRPSGNCGLDG
jgi:hypothetical protein